MSYSISSTGEGADKVIQISNQASGTSVEILAFGGLLNAFRIPVNGKPFNVVAAYEGPADVKKNITNGFHCAKLSPFVCRLHNARFRFEGETYTISKHFDGDNAIHGLLYDQVFEFVHQHITEKTATVELLTHFRPGKEGFPFPYTLAVAYTLGENNSLTVETTVTNTGKTDMPLSDGWHPYFTFGKKIDEAELRFRSKDQVIFDDKLLPTGEKKPYSAFHSYKKLGSTELDNCFTLEDEDSPTLQLKDEAAGVELKIYPEKTYPFLQIYTPPERTSIAVENLSAAPDAFNNGLGLIVAQPGSVHHFVTRYELNAL